MTYFVELDSQKERKVDLTSAERGQWQATVDDGVEIGLALRGIRADGRVLCEVDGRLRAFRLDEATASIIDEESGRRFHVQAEAISGLVLSTPTAATQATPESVVRSPITGVVLEVLVEVGDDVVMGQPVAIVEAMKMENVLTAPMRGRIEDIAAQAGATVFTDDLILTIAEKS